MEQIGEIAINGFSVAELEGAKQIAEEKWGCETVLVDLAEGVEGAPPACVLVIRNALGSIFGGDAERVLREAMGATWDKKYFDRRRGRVLNKHARSNNVVADFEQKADFAAGKGTVISFACMPLLQEVREAMASLGSRKFSGLIAEGNRYNDGGERNNGIGWHGDAERRRVIAVRMGANPSMQLHYQWYLRNKTVGERITIPLNSGDMYVMSEKAVGYDWKRSSILTLRHATGAPKFVD